jgi:REP element-mobilizing transposase RayT
MPDHVHLVLKVPAMVSAAGVMQHVKGTSSTFGRDHCGERRTFGWQDHYGVFSFSGGEKKRIIAYVLNQKTHH